MASPNRILIPGKPLTFSQYFELPFTLADIVAEFGVEVERSPLLLPAATLPESMLNDSITSLQRELARNRKRIDLVNEMARREALIGPVLFEVAELTDQRINVEYSIAVSEHLKGTVDYYLPSHNLLIIEAKQSDLVRGFTQLAVELIALDQWTRSQAPILYGIVTTGEDWLFGLLERSRRVIQQDERRFRVPEELRLVVERLVGILQ